ncbi:SPOR domain-containing protein [Legionella lytica]|uniref:SPOR domain-containing protein n=1 Tax=Legionella lytica TaxID=96232 RepID=A0ABY4Y6X7_9GAMM|nr:SPOR domain-containing protein [Legionella lytica]USQ13368.1 SPOR domain-containing protein [Legionella lytica]
MGREYKTKRSGRAHTSAPQQILVMAVCFLLGYFTATVFDVDAISHWVNSQVLAHHEARKEAPKPQPERQAAIPPKPKFEFYTLLTNEKTPSSQQAANNAARPAATTTVAATPTAAAPNVTATTAQTAVAATTVTASASAPKSAPAVAKVQVAEVRPITPAVSRGSFSVQVAAFKARRDAEQMKGILTLKGFNVSVIPINHASKGIWYRVVVGPYANRSLAQRAQGDLARNSRLRGMVTAG